MQRNRTKYIITYTGGALIATRHSMREALALAVRSQFPCDVVRVSTDGTRTIIDNDSVWEDAREAYLSER